MIGIGPLVSHEMEMILHRQLVSRVTGIVSYLYVSYCFLGILCRFIEITHCYNNIPARGDFLLFTMYCWVKNCVRFVSLVFEYVVANIGSVKQLNSFPVLSVKEEHQCVCHFAYDAPLGETA